MIVIPKLEALVPQVGQRDELPSWYTSCDLEKAAS